MQVIERGPVSPVRDIVRSLVAGAVTALPLGLLLALLDFPNGGDTLASFLLVFAFFLPLGLVFRALLHGLYWSVNRGLSTPGPERWSYLVYSRPVIAFGAVAAAANAVLALATRDCRRRGELAPVPAPPCRPPASRSPRGRRRGPSAPCRRRRSGCWSARSDSRAPRPCRGGVGGVGHPAVSGGEAAQEDQLLLDECTGGGDLVTVGLQAGRVGREGGAVAQRVEPHGCCPWERSTPAACVSSWT